MVKAAGEVYKLTVYVGDRLDEAAAAYSAALTLTGLGSIASSTGPAPSNGDFTLTTVSYTTVGADIGRTLGISLSSTGSQANWDVVSLSKVPLPAAAWLFGSAILGLVTVARRKQQA